MTLSRRQFLASSVAAAVIGAPSIKDAIVMVPRQFAMTYSHPGLIWGVYGAEFVVHWTVRQDPKTW